MHGMETAQGEVVPPTNSRAKWTMPKTETGIPDTMKAWVLGDLKAHNHSRCPLTFQLVSSGTTMGLPRMVSQSAA